MKKILIIGAGIIGLSISYYLSKHNFDIAVVEKNRAGQEASWAAAGMLAAQSEFDQYEDLMELCIKSRDMYGSYCKDIENASGIKVDFQQSGMIRPALSEEQSEHLKKNHEWQKKKGFETEFLDGSELRKLEPGLSKKILCGLHTKNDGHVNNRKLMEALIRVNKKNNVTIIENTQVTDFLIKNKKINGVKTSNGTIESNLVINCAGAWASQIKNGVPKMEVKPIMGQMVSLHAEKNAMSKVIFPLSEDPYIVPRKNKTLIGSTMEDIGFRKETREKDIQELLEKSYQIVPKLKKLKIKETWSGFRPYTHDKNPVIGKTGIENLYIATGHGRNGILLAPITAKAMEELMVNGKVMPEIKGYGMERFSDLPIQ